MNTSTSDDHPTATPEPTSRRFLGLAARCRRVFLVSMLAFLVCAAAVPASHSSTTDSEPSDPGSHSAGLTPTVLPTLGAGRRPSAYRAIAG
jgi:hypothetical protein